MVDLFFTVTFIFFFYLLFLRSDVKTMYQVSCSNYPNKLIQACESGGQETIYHFVERIFQLPGNKFLKPHLEKMIFYNSSGECLNVGLPVGVLSTEEIYECRFKDKNLTFDPSHLCRQYAVEDYSSDWKLNYFQVLCSKGKIAPGVSDFSKISITKMKIYFFNDETIFEALVRDNRFKEEKLRSCGATFDQSQTPLSSKAVNIQGKDIKIVLLNEKDSTLPESVSPRPHPKPSITSAKQIKQEHASAASSASCVTPWPVDCSTPATARGSLETRYNSARFVEITFDKCKTFTVGKNAKELVKRRKKLENFALKQGCSCYVYENEDLNEIAQSVGAIFKLNLADHPHLIGTCFMIGMGCIITNKHVEEEISKTAKDRIYVNFHFKKEGQADLQRFFIDRLIIYSWELDYAILRMENPNKQLPPCIFSHDTSIMDPACPERNWSLLDDKPLRLIGHPRGEPKQIDLMCTINALPQSGLECWCYTMRRRKEAEAEAEAVAAKDYHEGKDRRRRTYQSSRFFHGSSGSPGIVHVGDKKWLVVLHARGFKDDKGDFFIEQGVLLTEIFKDVEKQISEAQQGPLKDISVRDLFASVDYATQAFWGEPMEH